ncbi:MAG: hypothetical protein FGM57_03310 [Candidatus Taylorbacteria bacterium]|nr:hypothetical protein [Candidatus Taylorbacteria bacterium]
MDITELIESKMDSLPSSIKDILVDDSAFENVKNVGKIHGLDDVDQDILAEEVVLVLIHENSISKFKKNLELFPSLREKAIQEIFTEIDKVIFKPVKKFLKETETKSVPVYSEPTPSTPIVSTEDINHHEILGEIENPTPSLKTTLENTVHGNEKSVSNVTVMPKEAQKLMSQGDTLPIETTSAPSLQEAVANVIPTIGGFRPIDDPLKPTAKISEGLDDKLSTITKTPVKEVYIPKKPDPYREPIE